MRDTAHLEAPSLRESWFGVGCQVTSFAVVALATRPCRRTRAVIPWSKLVFKPSSATLLSGPSVKADDMMVPCFRTQPGLEGFRCVKFCRNLVSICKFGGFFF